MQVTFHGRPNELVTHRVKKQWSKEYKNKPLFRFDAEGNYVTDDPQMIERLKRNNQFSYDEEKNTSFKCKKCGEEFDNRGLFLAHHRAHKREESN